MKSGIVKIKQGFPKKRKFAKSKLLKIQLMDLIKTNSLGIGSVTNCHYSFIEIQSFFLAMNLEKVSGNLVPLVFADNFGFNLPDQETVKNRVEIYSILEIEKRGNQFLIDNAIKSSVFSNSKKLEKIKKKNTHVRRIKAKNQSNSIRQRERNIDPPLGLYVSIDFTLIPFYPRDFDAIEKENEELASCLTKNQRKKSTTIFWGYHTVYSTEAGSRQILSVHMLRREKNKKGIWKRERLDKVVPNLIDPIIDKLDIKGIVADGDYNGIGIYRDLISKKLDFVIRGKLDDKMRKIITKIDTSNLQNGQGIEVTNSHIMGIGKNKVEVKLIIVKRGQDTIPLHLPPYSQLSPEQALLIYEERFGIETSYREINRYLPPTCSTSPKYRLAMYFLTVFFFNLLLLYYEIVVIGSNNFSKWDITLVAIHQKLRRVFAELLVENLFND